MILARDLLNCGANLVIPPAATKYACLLSFSTTDDGMFELEGTEQPISLQGPNIIGYFPVQFYLSYSPRMDMDADLNQCHVLRTFLIVLVSECICNTGWKGFIQASRPRVILQLSSRYFMLQRRLRALTNQDLSCSILTRTPSRENNPPKTVILDYRSAPTKVR